MSWFRRCRHDWKLIESVGLKGWKYAFKTKCSRCSEEKIVTIGFLDNDYEARKLYVKWCEEHKDTFIDYCYMCKENKRNWRNNSQILSARTKNKRVAQQIIKTRENTKKINSCVVLRESTKKEHRTKEKEKE